MYECENIDLNKFIARGEVLIINMIHDTKKFYTFTWNNCDGCKCYINGTINLFTYTLYSAVRDVFILITYRFRCMVMYVVISRKIKINIIIWLRQYMYLVCFVKGVHWAYLFMIKRRASFFLCTHLFTQ